MKTPASRNQCADDPEVTGAVDPAGEAAPALQRGREGFTLVEVIVALVILTVGLLAFAGTTMSLIRQVTTAGLTTDRTMAVQSVVERLTALPYDSLVDGSETVGAFDVRWEVHSGTSVRDLEIVSVGPGLVRGEGRLGLQSVDTLHYRILQP